MEDNFKSIEDIRTIRKMMEESTRFLSLSGLSGIFAGVFAIAGALIAYFLILNNGSIHQDEYFRILTEKETLILRWKLVADALCVLILSIIILFLVFHLIKQNAREKPSGPLSQKGCSSACLFRLLPVAFLLLYSCFRITCS